jgi:hypothetical protein
MLRIGAGGESDSSDDAVRWEADAYDDDDEAAATASLEVMHVLQQPAGRRWRALAHHRGSFEPEFVARISVISLWIAGPGDSEVANGYDASPDTSPDDSRAAVAAAGWTFVATLLLLLLQGGGDAVARVCGPRAARWEANAVRRNPDRTFAHAVAPFRAAHAC